jgi:hypothetical protein
MNYLSQTSFELTLQSWAQIDPQIESFGFGQLYNQMGEPKPEQKYKGMWVNPTQTEVNEWTIVRSYQVIIYDLVFEVSPGKTNQNSVVSDCEEIAFRFVRFLRNFTDDFNIQAATIQPFSDKWLDNVSGVLLDIRVEFNFESADCKDPDYSDVKIKYNEV